VYASFGTKVRVLTAVIDARLAPAGQQNVMDRPEALAVRDEPDQRAQLRRFAHDIAAICTRVRPIYEVLRTASASEPEVREVFAEMEHHRLANMRRLTSWLAQHGDLAVDEDRAAEIIWALASPMSRGCSATSKAGTKTTTPTGSRPPSPQRSYPTRQPHRARATGSRRSRVPASGR
jgi:hypothetical protein